MFYVYILDGETRAPITASEPPATTTPDPSITTATTEAPITPAVGNCGDAVVCTAGSFAFQPDPCDCTKFYQCSYGRALLGQCAAGTVWDPTITSCNWLYNVPPPCGIQGITQPPTDSINCNSKFTKVSMCFCNIIEKLKLMLVKIVCSVYHGTAVIFPQFAGDQSTPGPSTKPSSQQITGWAGVTTN